MTRRASEPEPYEWPEGHVWLTTVSVPLRWLDGRWQVPLGAAPAADGAVGTLCSHGMHLDDPDARARCEAVRARLDTEPIPTATGLARQLAALEGLVLAPPAED